MIVGFLLCSKNYFVFLYQLVISGWDTVPTRLVRIGTVREMKLHESAYLVDTPT